MWSGHGGGDASTPAVWVAAPAPRIAKSWISPGSHLPLLPLNYGKGESLKR